MTQRLNSMTKNGALIVLQYTILHRCHVDTEIAITRTLSALCFCLQCNKHWIKKLRIWLWLSWIVSCNTIYMIETACPDKAPVTVQQIYRTIHFVHVLEWVSEWVNVIQSFRIDKYRFCVYVCDGLPHSVYLRIYCVCMHTDGGGRDAWVC